ncbi:uncharacterized protein TNCV_529311 [Trichonephila clavipes]|nr:uncharacterized protein TNCV_529311 [Trichonephila clavipes]
MPAMVGYLNHWATAAPVGSSGCENDLDSQFGPISQLGKIKIPVQVRIFKAQVPPSGEETGRQNYLRRLGLGSNPGEGMDVCKCIVPSRRGGALNSRRAANPLVRLVEGEERWETLDHPQGVLPEH